MINPEFVYSVKRMLKHMPEWSRRYRVLLIAGRECIVEYSPAEKVLKITEVRCTKCGECCMGMTPNSTAEIHWGADDEGNCLKLKKEGKVWECTAGQDTPIRCFPDVTLNCDKCEMVYYTEEGVTF